MKKKSKFLLLSIGIILVMSFAFGCTEDTQDPVVDDDIELPEHMTISAGFLNGKYIENDMMILEFDYTEGDNEEYDGNLKLNTKDSDLFDDLDPSEYYMIAYDDDNKLISIETNETIKELILKGQEATAEEVADENEIEVISPDDNFDTDGLTLIDSYSIDIYGNEEEEKVELYTDAQKDSEGNIMWDDGQNWKLVIEGKQHAFVLFDDYLQLASIEFFVYTIDEDFYISTINSGTANLTMTEYKYNREDEVFEKNIKSNTSGNVNMIYKSVSDL